MRKGGFVLQKDGLRVFGTLPFLHVEDLFRTDGRAMKFSMSRALVPFLSLLPRRPSREVEVLPPLPEAGRSGWSNAPPEGAGFGLVRQETHLRDTDQVKQFLPDILGRALARIWIDRSFRERFAEDPIGTMAEYNVFLPESIDVEFVADGVSRPRIVVYERRLAGPRRRLLYLHLVMMAGT